jgi:hypothetical protein
MHAVRAGLDEGKAVVARIDVQENGQPFFCITSWLG